jgi:hypothetical protein
MNEYVTKFTQLSCYAPHAYALEARDFENFQGMVNKALVLENHRGVMERKRKLVR